MDVAPLGEAAMAVEPASSASAEQATELLTAPAEPAARMSVRTLFEAHFDYVWRSLRRLGVAEADVEDALQEVFVVVHRKLPEFAARSKVTTWLFGICYRVASEYARRAHVRREQATDEMPEQPDPSASPEDRYEGREAREKLDEVLAYLDTDKRAVFVLYEIDELPVEQIAEALGLRPGTVYSRLKAAREEFEKALARMRARWAHQSRRPV